MEEIKIDLLHYLTGNLSTLRNMLESEPKNLILPEKQSKCSCYDYYYGIL